MQKTINNQKGNIYKNFLELIAVGIVTGIVVGTIVTFFNILVHEGEHISRDIYGYIRANLWFLPLLLLTLALGGIRAGRTRQYFFRYSRLRHSAGGGRDARRRALSMVAGSHRHVRGEPS